MLHTLSLPRQVQALAWDATTARLWVATKTTVTAYNDVGVVVHGIDLGKHPEVHDLALDSTSGALWIAGKESVRRYTAGGGLAVEAKLKKVEHLVSDGRGGVWVATEKSLLRLNQAGVPLVHREQFRGAEQVVALVVHPLDHSLWAASKKHLHHLSPEGQSLQRVAFPEGRITPWRCMLTQLHLASASRLRLRTRC